MPDSKMGNLRGEKVIGPKQCVYDIQEAQDASGNAVRHQLIYIRGKKLRLRLPRRADLE